MDMLPHGLADALDDGAVGLAVDNERIDAAGHIVDAGVAGNRHFAGVRVHLDLADRAAVGKHRVVHLVVGDDREPIRQIAREVHAGRLGGQLEDIEVAIGVPRHETPVRERNMVGWVPSTAAAMRLPLWISSAAALENTVAAWRIERPEWEPPPTRTTSVSPRMMSTVSTGMPRRSDTTWAKLVSCP